MQTLQVILQGVPRVELYKIYDYHRLKSKCICFYQELKVKDFIHRHVIITRRDNNYGFAIIGTLRRQGRIQDFFVAYFFEK